MEEAASKRWILKEEFRDACRIPLGLAIYRDPSETAVILRELVLLLKPPLLITVGDFVTANLIEEEGLRPNVAVVDKRTQRRGFTGQRLIEKLVEMGYECYECGNPPGGLTVEAIEIVERAVEAGSRGDRVVVVVEGEEDLLALPIIVAAPPRSFIVYGLWLGGAVVIVNHPYIRRGVERFMEEGFSPVL
ncbi:MAG TPA: DUF359 domain-containing protein [Thermofilaceae archaeon]|nr:DUF359 domain-containing protein [Thermofilaceae archaeon]